MCRSVKTLTAINTVPDQSYQRNITFLSAWRMKTSAPMGETVRRGGGGEVNKEGGDGSNYMRR